MHDRVECDEYFLELKFAVSRVVVEGAGLKYTAIDMESGT